MLAKTPKPSSSTVPIDHLLGPDDPERMRDFVQYWMSRRGDNLMPAFSDVDPVDIPWALSQIYIVEARSDGDFIYRLAGEAIVQRYSRPLKGVRITDLFGAQTSVPILARWCRVIAGPAGYYSYSQHTSNRAISVRARRVLLPLGEDGQTADHLVGFTVFEDASRGDDLFADGIVTKDIRWADLTR